jgi:hypothetical protein
MLLIIIYQISKDVSKLPSGASEWLVDWVGGM